MNLTSVDIDNARIITVEAERIDAAVAIRFKEDMRARTEGGPDRVILDLSAVQFIDSSGLGAIVARSSPRNTIGQAISPALPAPPVGTPVAQTRNTM